MQKKIVRSFVMAVLAAGIALPVANVSAGPSFPPPGKGGAKASAPVGPRKSTAVITRVRRGTFASQPSGPR